ncbi:MAG TPA: M20 peptidase aminoacylase family protein [Metalysinibacillus jejuensis]|uniref:M20 peptidase aminoacylase family protein n=1 Tax=Metalysinibacillus jejuensis TaxID=914327 RepID=A0A921T566_9BACL|nr:M20 peptidase aminoacylase family protein [Metalysinibacillus jejuensis]
MIEPLTELRPKIMKIFEHLHANPEVSFEEYNTTVYIERVLQEAGYTPHRFKNCTGLYVDVGSGAPFIGLRADMDALWQEVDGVFKANHSCGHDGHMTMALGSLLLLKELPQNWQGTIRVIFQPAEEKGLGALAVLKEGVIDDLSYLFGVHVRPVEELSDGTYCGALYHGASVTIEGNIVGEDAHAARPHLGQNAIEVGAAIIEDLRSTYTNPMVPTSVKMTRFQAGGTAANIIPGRAEFTLDVRAQENSVMKELKSNIQRVMDSEELLYHVKINTHIASDIVAAEVNPIAMHLMEQAIIDSVGEANLRPPVHTPGGEDFHHYAVQRPALKTTMLGLGCGLEPGLHHPHMKFNQARLITGIEILTRVLLKALQQANQEG